MIVEYFIIVVDRCNCGGIIVVEDLIVVGHNSCVGRNPGEGDLN